MSTTKTTDTLSLAAHVRLNHHFIEHKLQTNVTCYCFGACWEGELIKLSIPVKILHFFCINHFSIGFYEASICCVSGVSAVNKPAANVATRTFHAGPGTVQARLLVKYQTVIYPSLRRLDKIPLTSKHGARYPPLKPMQLQSFKFATRSPNAWRCCGDTTPYVL